MPSRSSRTLQTSSTPTRVMRITSAKSLASKRASRTLLMSLPSLFLVGDTLTKEYVTFSPSLLSTQLCTDSVINRLYCTKNKRHTCTSSVTRCSSRKWRRRGNASNHSSTSQQVCPYSPSLPCLLMRLKIASLNITDEPGILKIISTEGTFKFGAETPKDREHWTKIIRETMDASRVGILHIHLPLASLPLPLIFLLVF